MLSSDKEIAGKILETLGYDKSLYNNPKIQYVIYQFIGRMANIAEELSCKHVKTYEQKKTDPKTAEVYVYTLCIECQKEVSKRKYQSKKTLPTD